VNRIYVSADIEGVACISAPTEVDMAKQAEYAPFREQMTAEVAAACAGAFAAGADAVFVKDAHWTGRNIDPHRLAAPPGKTLRLIRGWSGHPFAMVQGIDAGFRAAAFVGYHSAAGRAGNPLAHTVSGRMFTRVELNGALASEFHLYAYAAASVGVPVVFLSGDRALCEEAESLIEGIATVATLEGHGASVTSLLPGEATALIEQRLQQVLRGTLPAAPRLPADFHFRLCFTRATDAYAKSFFPGVRLASDTEVVLETGNYFDVLTFLWFAAQ
jgi:D-amino peptidase